jgi:hypothetical protein
MGFPIAIGAKSVSYQGIRSPEPIEEVSEDGATLSPLFGLQRAPTVALGVSGDKKLQALVSIHFYEVVKHESGSKDHGIAEVCVAISPLSEHLSRSRFRESIFRVRMPHSYERMPADSSNETSQKFEAHSIEPHILFTNDAKNLICIIPTNNGQNSIAVLFHIRKVHGKSIAIPGHNGRLPAPPYLLNVPAQVHKKISEALVAKNPCLLETREESDDFRATSATAPPSAKSILLVGSSDGRILAVSLRPFQVQGTIHMPNDDNSTAVLALESCVGASGRADDFGRVACLTDNGIVTVFDLRRLKDCALTGALSETKKSTLNCTGAEFAYADNDAVGMYTLDKVCEIEKRPFECCKLLSDLYLAVMEILPDKSTVSVWALCSGGQTCCISELQVTRDNLRESAHATFTLACNRSPHAPTSDMMPPLNWRSAIGLDYDPVSGCLAVSSILKSRDDRNQSFGSSNSEPFVSLWSWKLNVQGLTIALSKKPNSCSLHCPMHPVSRLLFAASTDISAKSNTMFKVTHVIGSANTKSSFLQKEIFDIGILSPSADIRLCRTALHKTNSLLLSSRSVIYPRVSRSATNDAIEVDWQESKIPIEYTSSYGAPLTGCIGHRRGLSVAVSSDNGLCLLDCSERSDGNTVPSKWRHFGNAVEESLFKVTAMEWWEGVAIPSANEMFQDDLLLAIIEVHHDGKAVVCLSCFSPRRLDFGHQLLSSQSKGVNSKWGIKLSDRFSSARLDILPEPKADSEIKLSAATTRRAVILISDASDAAAYEVYQLQIIEGNSAGFAESYLDLQPFTVVGNCASVGTVGSCCDLFLAGASFRFDCRQFESFSADDGLYVATLGIIRPATGGVDAIAISANSVTAFGKVVERFPSVDPKISEVVNYWLSTIISDADRVYFFWCLQLANGSLITWVVPTFPIDMKYNNLSGPSIASNGWPFLSKGFESVHPKVSILGQTSKAGTLSKWMQQSSSGTRTDFPLGCVPGSFFGCLLRSMQACRKLHQSVCLENDSEPFRLDFLDHDVLYPGDLVLSPPVSITSVYSLLLNSNDCESSHNAFSSKLCQRQIHKGLHLDPFADSFGLSLQLLVLRTAEALASSKVSLGGNTPEAIDDVMVMFTRLVNAIRSSLQPLNGAALFLDVGRQIEPSCLATLFPLPSARNGSHTSFREMEDILSIFLAHGTISSAVKSLPLLLKDGLSKSMCVIMFQYCLRILKTSLNSYNSSLPAEVRSLGDIFRYGLRLERLEDDESDLLQTRLTNSESLSDTEFVEPPDEGYSLLCGIFGRQRIVKEQDLAKAVDAFIDRGFDLDLKQKEVSRWWRTCDESESKRRSFEKGSSITEAASRFVLDALADFPCQPSAMQDWKPVIATSWILVGEGIKSLPMCTHDEFKRLVERQTICSLKAALPKELRVSGNFTQYFVSFTQGLNAQASPTEAGYVLDVVLVLLSNWESCAAELPGLALLAIVVAHGADRIDELGFDRNMKDHPLWCSYLDSQKK